MDSDETPPLVLRHSILRSIAFIAIVLGWTAFELRHAMSDSPAPLAFWLHAMGGMVAVILGYVGIMTAIQAVRNIPVLQTSAKGILVCNPWGPMFVRWTDITTFEPGKFRWLRIRLRDEARPMGTIWALFLSRSIWARNTLVVQMYTTIPRPDDVARVLTDLRAQQVAHHGHP
jgi:hypothetical protein